MKVLIDENLPKALACGLNGLFAGEHEIVHIRDLYGPAVKDIDWIPDLSKQGRWVVISGGRAIKKKKAEYHVFRSSRSVGFFLAPGLLKAPLIKQAERILANWEGIETFAAGSAPGAMYEIHMSSMKIAPL
ncbi:hypothetical protein [Methylobacterium nodulans]|uniref:VapC45 PIN like domain-containing protein n=1 Tax=Methylobacterium nodulans (strain LMG 21967 / CNCM I-2342 / ORS 2060) TaxID=460265 RepID=B8IW93_METNO|nr:hypothetical protein [Methylobacterium nodulans]ACL62683.1 conserved hypothetical protein [Methylobacterium nodulans ORS 2060]